MSCTIVFLHFLLFSYFLSLKPTFVHIFILIWQLFQLYQTATEDNFKLYGFAKKLTSMTSWVLFFCSGVLFSFVFLWSFSVLQRLHDTVAALAKIYYAPHFHFILLKLSLIKNYDFENKENQNVLSKRKMYCVI